MNVVDSCGWLEYFADGPNADFFAPAIEDISGVIVPTICIYEVFRRILQQRSEGEALQAIAVLTQGQEVELDTTLGLSAAKMSADEYIRRSWACRWRTASYWPRRERTTQPCGRRMLTSRTLRECGTLRKGRAGAGLKTPR